MNNKFNIKSDDDSFKKLISWDDMYARNKNFQCGYCGKSVCTETGRDASIHLKYANNEWIISNRERINDLISQGNTIGVYICPNCQKPTFIDEIIYDTQIPLPKRDTNLKNIPLEISKVYQEALDAYSAGAFTGTTLLCRKLLMNIAVDLGAKENQTFAEYVNFLDKQHYISPRSHNWVDEIRKIGNKATHNLDLNTKKEADKDLTFCEMILKTNYDYPNEINNKNKQTFK